jgi:Mg2+ and Co2+ transporter CorA
MSVAHAGDETGHVRGRARVSALEPLAGLVWAFRVDHEHSAEMELADSAALSGQLGQAEDAWFWFHFDLGDRRAPRTLRIVLDELLAHRASVPEASVAGFVQVLTTPELHFTRGVVHGALLDSVIDVDGTGSGEQALLSVVIGPKLLLTGRRRHLRGIEALRRAARAGRPGEKPIDLIDSLVRMDTGQRASSLEHIADTLNRIEDRVLSESGEIDRGQIIRIRHTLVRQHRELDGLRRLFERVDQEIRQESARSRTSSEGGAADVPQWEEFASLLQHLNALMDRCLALLDRARLLQQEVSDQLTVQTNRQLYVLSILTAALVPPTIVVGVFGMNTGGLPLTDTPFGFVSALALCGMSSMLVIGVLAGLGLIRRPRLGKWANALRGRREHVEHAPRDAHPAHAATSIVAPVRHD